MNIMLVDDDRYVLEGLKKLLDWNCKIMQKKFCSFFFAIINIEWEDIQMNIMLVDDDRYVLEGLKKLLDWNTFHGKLTATASNGAEALELFLHTRPDVVISDIKMPVMDGISLARHIHEHAPDITIILLTSYGEFEYAQKAIQYQVANYILKPITKEKINDLQLILEDIYHKRNDHKEEFLSNWKPTFEESILAALRSQDAKMFDDFFSSPHFQERLARDHSNAYGIQLLNFLYLYLGELHINPDIVAASKERAMDEYWNLPDKDAKANYLISTYYDTLLSIHTQKNKNLDSISSYVKEYVENHYTEPDLNISALADKLNVSLSYLSTVFKQTAGINLSSYISAMRISHAKKVLADPSHSIAEAAILSGYEDAKYFARLFKRKCGMTPSEYRNLSLQKNTLLPKGELS